MVGRVPEQRNPYPVQDLSTALSRRERTLLIGLAQGMTFEELAKEMYLNVSTAKRDLRYVGERLGLPRHDRKAIKVLVMCLQRGWLRLGDIPRL